MGQGRETAPRRSRRGAAHVIRILAVGAGLGLPVLLGGCGAAAPPSDLHGIVLDGAYGKPDFTLTDTHGRAFDFRQRTAGRLTLLYFGYTNCTDVCPLQMHNIAQALRALPAEVAHQTRVVFVTVDPQRDTAARLRSWLDNFDTAFVGLRGSPEVVARVEHQLNLAATVDQGHDAAGHEELGHAPEVVAFTADDSAHVLYAVGTTTADWTNDLPRLLHARAWRRTSR
jgi:protein SCO1/2